MFSLTSFLLYTFVTSITPGPNNIMSMSLGLKVGFRKTLYFNAGVLTGFCIITLLCAFFCAKLNEWIPEIRLPMLVLGTIYLIWLAVKILRSTYDTKAVEPKKGQAYFSGLFLQFVNVKVIVSSPSKCLFFRTIKVQKRSQRLRSSSQSRGQAVIWFGLDLDLSLRDYLPITRS